MYREKDSAGEDGGLARGKQGCDEEEGNGTDRYGGGIRMVDSTSAPGPPRRRGASPQMVGEAPP